MIKRTIELDVSPTSEELAEAWWHMNSEQQAKFFIHLGIIAEFYLATQMQFVRDSADLTANGRPAMHTIEEYGS